MPVRHIVHIDEEKCDGCGECVTACAEGAIALVDGKARLVSEVYCDGLGACLGTCPQDAITVEEREAAAFDEAATHHHVEQLKAKASLPTAAPVLAAARTSSPAAAHHGGCPGSRVMSLPVRQPATHAASGGDHAAPAASHLTNWPIQLTLVPPQAPWLRGSDLVLAADCVAFAVGDFHSRFLQGHAVLIACPKLDTDPIRYVDKLAEILDTAGVRSLSVVHMEVPCCSGLTQIATLAAEKAQTPVPVRDITVSIGGQVLRSSTIESHATTACDRA